ncbi:hypothetical protein FB567DRAFT_575544 [Paraphoma chrysanthemicola]|uniref:F-box domain-containing protein n=1 Tax=Paraphoma chrysanthemicola TaxID=798071 RepID=A0A8K0RL79_9PLEO|nr:hypothetical protein FB567DRAFT_575544 [Paraphoma chrysanthemicola]
MAAPAATTSRVVPGLLRLPNELLLVIATDLTNLDLRRLGRTCRKVHSFARNYLARYRYDTGLLALPKKIVVNIAQYLDIHQDYLQHDRSHFARVSQKLYPLVTQAIARRNIQEQESWLLNYAPNNNLKSMANTMLRLGGNVETRRGCSIAPYRCTPLHLAALCGHKRMVKLFLAAGAKEIIDGERVPLELAMRQSHESVSLLLCRGLRLDDRFSPQMTILKAACFHKMTALVRFFLQDPSSQGSESGGKAENYICSTSLHTLLARDASEDDFVKRKVHEDVYQIATMLLQHNANPDELLETTSGRLSTARELASRHPDPRIRLMLPSKSIALTSNIGPLSHPSQVAPEPSFENNWNRPRFQPKKKTRSATLWDFIDDAQKAQEEDPCSDGYAQESGNNKKGRRRRKWTPLR